MTRYMSLVLINHSAGSNIPLFQGYSVEDLCLIIAALEDAIIVPQRFERIPWMRNIKDITTIMAQIAVTAGTVLLGSR